MTPRALLLGSFQAALAAADPLVIVPRHLPAPPRGRTIVVGAGKAAASMAKAVENNWPADKPLEGLVITRYAHGYTGEDALKRIRVVEAGHPVPDTAGEAAAREIMALVKSAKPEDLVLVLVSGGGSSLLAMPAGDVSMEDLKSVTRDLLACGAPIQEINVVRKHLSAIQGGRLAAASAAPIRALIISDVVGDNPTAIASGPTAADTSTYIDALTYLKMYRITPPVSITRHLSSGARGEIAETLKPFDPVFDKVENLVIATALASLNAAAAFFQRHGITPMVMGDSVTGEARMIGHAYAVLAMHALSGSHVLKPPMAIISGGECTVTLSGANQARRARGGRCTEFLLSLGITLDGCEGITAIACDTDGIDGSENNAGGLLFPDSLPRALAAGVNANIALATNDAYGFFEATNDLVVTGPTRTNVNDFRVMLIR